MINDCYLAGFAILSQNHTLRRTMLRAITIAILTLTLLAAVEGSINHLNDKTFNNKVTAAPFTLVYIYSSSCNFCQEFTPIFQQLSKHQQMVDLGVAFSKMDGPAYENLTHSLEVYSYPSVLLFKKGVNLPLHHRKERSEKEIIKFVNEHVNATDDSSLMDLILNMTNQQRVASKAAIFYGKRDSNQFRAWDVIASRDGYISWIFMESAESKVIVGDQEVTDFSSLEIVEDKVEEIYARLHGVSEQAWLKMMQRKKFSVIYFNKHGNKKTKQLIFQLASQLYKANFMQIDGNDDEYKNALRALGLPNEENIVSVDQKYDVIYVAPSPYTEEGLKDFVSKAMEHKLDPYRKTQRTDKPNKLTRDNYEQKLKAPQDVLMFLYDKSQPISKQLMKLFEFLLQKLKDNKNLLLLRCDVGMNEMDDKLGFVIKPTPKVLFLRNRMRDHPIHFSGKTISASTIIDFIMENTTFDFEDQWAEL